MTKDEFLIPMNKLIETFGKQQFPPPRIAVIFEEIKDLELDWWAKICRRMILEYNPKFNIAEAARSERNASTDAERTLKNNRELDKALTKCSEDGFYQAMKSFGAKTPTEAFLKTLKQKGVG